MENENMFEKVNGNWSDVIRIHTHLENKIKCLEGFPAKLNFALDCSNNLLKNLEGCPEEITGIFKCSFNQLTSLEGGPKKVWHIYDCSHNYLTNLKGCATSGFWVLDCSDNPNLVDISDISPDKKLIFVKNCPKIEKFPEKINKTFSFIHPADCVRERIKKVPFYEVLEDGEDRIVVCSKSIGNMLLDSL